LRCAADSVNTKTLGDIKAPENSGGSADKLAIPFKAQYVALPGASSSSMEMLEVTNELPQDAGWEDLSFVHLGDKSGLFNYRGYYHQPIQVRGTVHSESPYLIIRLPQTGQTRVRSYGNNVTEENADQYSFYFHTADNDSVIENRVGEINHLVAPMISVDRLRAMFDGQSVPEPLRSFLKNKTENFTVTAMVSAAIRRIATEMQTSYFSGTMQSLYIQGKVFELMAEVMSDISGNRPSIARTLGADRRKAILARDILMAELADPPCAESLARRVGLSQRRLNEVFRDIYGDSVFKCLAQWRMQLAHDLLLGTNLPIKRIAHQIGYAHVNNFILAFSRKYNEPPATYRKQAGIFS